MLVVIGANGRTGVEIVREALRQGLPVRPVVRDDDDARRLEGLVPVNDIHYADADHPASLEPVLRGATSVLSCIDPRTAGHGSPVYDRKAAANIVNLAAELGVGRVVHISVIGGYRWSPSPLNRRSFHMDKWIRRAGITYPWTLCRVSGYHDELIEGHIRPPDGGRPHPIRPSSRYAPMSRRDAARAILHALPSLVLGRTLQVGGPEILSGTHLNALVQQYGPSRSSGPLTSYDPLPHGDMAVTPESTWVSVRWRPRETLAWALDPDHNPLPPEPAPLWDRAAPGPHPADRGQDFSLLRALGPALRRVLHGQLIEDLGRLGLPTAGVTLDFSGAAPRPDGLRTRVHGGELVELRDVRALTPDGALLHSGAVTFLHDELADVLLCWWLRPDGAMPAFVWEACDLGVRRRLPHHPRWSADPRVRSFAAEQHERVR